MIRIPYRILRQAIYSMLYSLSPGAFYSALRAMRATPTFSLSRYGAKAKLNPQNYHEWSYFNRLETKEFDTAEWIRSFQSKL